MTSVYGSRGTSASFDICTRSEPPTLGPRRVVTAHGRCSGVPGPPLKRHSRTLAHRNVASLDGSGTSVVWGIGSVGWRFPRPTSPQFGVQRTLLSMRSSRRTAPPGSTSTPMMRSSLGPGWLRSRDVMPCSVLPRWCPSRRWRSLRSRPSEQATSQQRMGVGVGSTARRARTPRGFGDASSWSGVESAITAGASRASC